VSKRAPIARAERASHPRLTVGRSRRCRQLMISRAHERDVATDNPDTRARPSPLPAYAPPNVTTIRARCHAATRIRRAVGTPSGTRTPGISRPMVTPLSRNSPFEGGTILKFEVSVGDDAYIDLEQHLAAALARDQPRSGVSDCRIHRRPATPAGGLPPTELLPAIPWARKRRRSACRCVGDEAGADPTATARTTGSRFPRKSGPSSPTRKYPSELTTSFRSVSIRMPARSSWAGRLSRVVK
jgi:hypothetical protein